MAEQQVDMGLVSAPTAAAESNSPPAAPQTSQPGHQVRTQQQRDNAARSSTPNPRSRGHSPARDRIEQMGDGPDRAAPAVEAHPDTAAQPAAQGERVKHGDVEMTAEEWSALAAEKAARDIRKASLPPMPEAYELVTPADFKPPPGVEFKFDASDPGIAAARNWAHAKGLDQAEFSQLLGIYASNEAAKEGMINTARAAEVAKLGATGPQRVDNVVRWLNGNNLGEMAGMLVTARQVEAVEGYIMRQTNQGAASFSQSHRAAPDQTKIPGYENMTFEQRRHAQDQRATGGGRR